MGGSFELGIVIPVYNEEKNILGLLNDWQKVFLTLQIEHRFFIVDDGSKDSSPALLASLSLVGRGQRRGHNLAIWQSKSPRQH